MKNLTLLKLGGSLITDKTVPLKFMKKNVVHVCQQIKKGYKKKDLSLIICLGTGSFGHYNAVKYNINNSFTKTKDQVGVCVVHDSVLHLGHLVADIFLQNEIPVFFINPASFLISQKNEIENYSKKIIDQLLAAGFIPLMIGDMIIDKTYGAVILSSDELLMELGRKYYIEDGLRPIIIQAGVTNGVLDKNNKTISHITKKNYTQVINSIDEVRGYDVTGGMKHKLNIARQLAELKIRTLLVNGLLPKDLFLALKGESSSSMTLVD